MDWDTLQNSASNIVFGILLFAMTIYWVSLSFFKEKNKIDDILNLDENICLFSFHAVLSHVGIQK